MYLERVALWVWDKRLIDFVYHSTLALRVIKKKKVCDAWAERRGEGL